MEGGIHSYVAEGEEHSRDLSPLHNPPDYLPSASGIPNISNQIKVAENTQDLSGLVGGSARMKRLRLQCLSKVRLLGSLPWLIDEPLSSPLNSSGWGAEPSGF